MDLTICERWKMSVPSEAWGWFLDWALREPNQVSRHLTAGFRAYGSLQLVYGPGELRSVREYFGGLGAQALMIQDGIRPDEHHVYDFSLDAVAHLRTALADRPVETYRADSYTLEPRSGDLFGLDFGDLTAWRLRPGEKHRELLDQVMAVRPKAVVLTDVAGPRLHLHRERYGVVLGVRPERLTDYRAYLVYLADWLRDTYGYIPVRCYWHRWSAVMSLVPGHQWTESWLHSVPDSPKGLTLHD